MSLPRWDNDDLDLEGLEDELSHLFKEINGFQTQEYPTKAARNHRGTYTKILQQRTEDPRAKYDREDYYYKPQSPSTI